MEDDAPQSPDDVLTSAVHLLQVNEAQTTEAPGGFQEFLKHVKISNLKKMSSAGAEETARESATRQAWTR